MSACQPCARVKSSEAQCRHSWIIGVVYPLNNRPCAERATEDGKDRPLPAGVQRACALWRGSGVSPSTSPGGWEETTTLFSPQAMERLITPISIEQEHKWLRTSK